MFVPFAQFQVTSLVQYSAKTWLWTCSSTLSKLLLANLYLDIFCIGIHCIYSPFCWHYIFWFLSMSTYLLPLFAWQICSPITICRSFLVLNWKVGLERGPTYLSGSNMFFFNCYPCNQILYLCSIKMKSFSINHPVYSKISKMKT